MPEVMAATRVEEDRDARIRLGYGPATQNLTYSMFNPGQRAETRCQLRKWEPVVLAQAPPRYRLVIGMRRSRPKALRVTRAPIGF